MKIENQILEEPNAYSLFIYAIRSPLTRDCYTRRLKIFFNHINLLTDNESMEERCNLFAKNALENKSWAFNNVLRFLQFQKERAERGEINGSTLRNFVKAIKLFYEMADIEINWKKITRGLPMARKYSDNRAPTIDEIQRIIDYPDRRIKAIVCSMASSGIRLGAWDYLRWGNISPIKEEGKVIAAKVTVYEGDNEQYFTFITPEAFLELEKWIEYRKQAGEKITERSWVMRQLWNTKKGRMLGLITAPKKLKSNGVKRLIEDALWTQGIRNKSEIRGKRYEFQANHGFRKWFKTQCELAGMKSINAEVLMGHSIGIYDSYYKITEEDLLKDYLTAVDFFTINEENKLKKEIDSFNGYAKENDIVIKEKLKVSEEELLRLKEQENVKCIKLSISINLSLSKI